MAEVDSGQSKSNNYKYKFRLSVLDRFAFRSIDVYNVFSTDLLFIFKNKKDKGVINGMAVSKLGNCDCSFFLPGENCKAIPIR